MPRFLNGILCVFIILCLCGSLTAQSVNVPLSYSVYDFIERFEAKGALKNVLNGTKPLSRKKTALIIKCIREKQESGYALSRVELDKLIYYEQEFREELEDLDSSYEIPEIRLPSGINNLITKIPGGIYQNGRNFLTYRYKDFSFFLDPILNQDNTVNDIDTLAAKDEVYRYSSGFHIRGSIGRRLGFYLDVRNTKEWGSRDYPKGTNYTSPGYGWVKNYGEHQFHDETIAYVVFKLAPLEFEFGKDFNRWGPGYRGTLLLSGNAASYDLVKLKYESDKFSYVSFLGSLTSFPRLIESITGTEDNPKIKYAEKYIAAHRLEINLIRGVDIGLHEAVIFGQRDIEMAYLNPVMFLRSAEHYLGDQDNALMGADLELYLVDGWKWYAEMLIDDIFTKKLGTDWIGNKLGFMFGSLWTDPFGFGDSSIRVEYSRIRPFVYSHRYPINVYAHFSTGLGHQNGPNTDEWFIRAEHDASRRLKLSAEFSFLRHGANPPGVNVGGDINLPHRGGIDPDEVGFLEGDVEETTSFKFNFSYEVFRNLFIMGNLNLCSGENFRISGIPERDFDSRKFFFAVRMNY